MSPPVSVGEGGSRSPNREPAAANPGPPSAERRDRRRAPRRARAVAGTQVSSLASQSQVIIQAGSSSFASAARLFDRETRESCTMLYAWCRYCDDVIDGQTLGHDQRSTPRAELERRLARLERLTERAWYGRPTGDTAFFGLAEVVRRHELPLKVLLEHLAGFRMDVEGAVYDELEDTLLYCYRVAGTVGLMMSRMMGVVDPETLDRACDLGIAFQLSNIARDVTEDASVGRVYLPARWLDEAGISRNDLGRETVRPALASVVGRLIDTADDYYASALSGIAALPLRSAWSVATARDVYRAIGHKVKRAGPHAWDARVSVSTPRKLLLTARGAAVALLARRLVLRERPADLWKRPA